MGFNSHVVEIPAISGTLGERPPPPASMKEVVSNMRKPIIERLPERLEELLDGFVRSDGGPAAWERRLLEIFNACGLQTQGPVRLKTESSIMEVDAEFTATMGGKPLRFAVEVKSSDRVETIRRAIDQARRIRFEGKYDRALVVIRGELPDSMREEADAGEAGYIDLLGIRELRSWLAKHAPGLQADPEPDRRPVALIIRHAMRAIAMRLAEYPDEIDSIEWRDLERVLREVFEGMGFGTTLTRSGKDGGFDLSLETHEGGATQLYLVEVKHWAVERPGKGELRKLVRVTAREGAKRGILLSSSGFSPSIYQGFTKAEKRSVALGGREKIKALCSTYYRLGTELWMPEQSLSDQLLDGLE